jgi:hypothetical protein
MNKNNSVVAIYKSHAEADAAVKELQRSGFDMKKLSIVGRDYHTDEHVVGYYNTGDRMKYWGKTGGLLGWVLGLVVRGRILLDSRSGAGSGSRANSQLDRRGAGRRCRGGRPERAGSRLVRTRDSQGQYRAVRDCDQDRQICADRPRFPGGNNSGPRGHQPHQPGTGGTPSAGTQPPQREPRGSNRRPINHVAGFSVGSRSEGCDPAAIRTWLPKRYPARREGVPERFAAASGVSGGPLSSTML